MARVTTGQKALEIAESFLQENIGGSMALHNSGISAGSVNWIIDFEGGLGRKLKVYVNKQNGSVKYKEL